MIDIVFWIIIGALSGWVGYLASRTDEKSQSLGTSIAVGVIGGVLGGVLMRVFGLVGSPYAVNPETVFTALIVSALFVTVYTLITNFFGTTSAN